MLRYQTCSFSISAIIPRSSGVSLPPLFALPDLCVPRAARAVSHFQSGTQRSGARTHSRTVTHYSFSFSPTNSFTTAQLALKRNVKRKAWELELTSKYLKIKGLILSMKMEMLLYYNSKWFRLT